MRPEQSAYRLGVVDDDPSIRETLAGFLEAEQYEVCCTGSADGLDQLMRTKSLDLVLLDIRLPGRDGLTITRELRQRSEMGIILIAGRNDKVDRIIGLEYGADDYIAKPIDERELLPRVRNLLRRVGHAHVASKPPSIVFDRFVLDLGRRRLLDNEGKSIFLTTAEFELLSIFARNPGQVMSRDRLMAGVSRRRWSSLDRTVDTLVRRLRQKLEIDPANPSLITTIHGIGYLLAR